MPRRSRKYLPSSLLTESSPVESETILLAGRLISFLVRGLKLEADAYMAALPVGAISLVDIATPLSIEAFARSYIRNHSFQNS